MNSKCTRYLTKVTSLVAVCIALLYAMTPPTHDDEVNLEQRRGFMEQQ